jgi:hypothetical protein
MQDSQADLFACAAAEAEKSTLARGELDRLRSLARGVARAGYSGDTGPLTAYSYDGLQALVAAGQRRHVSDYLAGCRSYARRRLLAKGAAIDLLAERVHELARAEAGYRVDASGVLAGGSWPARAATASSLAAAVYGASWGSGATAQRQLSRDHRSDVFKL